MHRIMLAVFFLLVFALPASVGAETLRPVTEAECQKLQAQGLSCGLISEKDAQALGLEGFAAWAPNMYRYCPSRVCNKACRRNNPGNIRYVPGTRAATIWGGRASRKGDFSYFPSLSYGFAAQVDLLRLYCAKYKRCTIYSAISRWAPAADNNRPLAYARRVSQITRIPIHRVYDPNDPDTMGKIAAAMACVENGGFPYPVDPLVQGLAMAMGKENVPTPPNVGAEIPDELERYQQVPPVLDPLSPYSMPGYQPPPFPAMGSSFSGQGTFAPPLPPQTTPTAMPDPDYQYQDLDSYYQRWQEEDLDALKEQTIQGELTFENDLFSEEGELSGVTASTDVGETADVDTWSSWDDTEAWAYEESADAWDSTGYVDEVSVQESADVTYTTQTDTETEQFTPLQTQTAESQTTAPTRSTPSRWQSLWQVFRPRNGSSAVQQPQSNVMIGSEAQRFFQQNQQALPQNIRLTDVVTKPVAPPQLQAPQQRPDIPLPQWQEEVNLIDAEALRRWYEYRRAQARTEQVTPAWTPTPSASPRVDTVVSEPSTESVSFWQRLWYWLSFAWLFR